MAHNFRQVSRLFTIIRMIVVWLVIDDMDAKFYIFFGFSAVFSIKYGCSVKEQEILFISKGWNHRLAYKFAAVRHILPTSVQVNPHVRQRVVHRNVHRSN